MLVGLTVLAYAAGNRMDRDLIGSCSILAKEEVWLGGTDGTSLRPHLRAAKIRGLNTDPK